MDKEYKDEFTLARAIHELIQRGFNSMHYDSVKKALDMVKVQYKPPYE